MRNPDCADCTRMRCGGEKSFTLRVPNRRLRRGRGGDTASRPSRRRGCVRSSDYVDAARLRRRRVCRAGTCGRRGSVSLSHCRLLCQVDGKLGFFNIIPPGNNVSTSFPGILFWRMSSYVSVRDASRGGRQWTSNSAQGRINDFEVLLAADTWRSRKTFHASTAEFSGWTTMFSCPEQVEGSLCRRRRNSHSHARRRVS